MNYYNFDIDKLIERYLPYALRNASFLAWCKALLSPFKTVLNNFLNYVQIARRELQQNGQVVRLEGLLNDLYDNEQRRIRIVDVSQAPLVLSSVNAVNLSSSTPTRLPSLSDYNFSVDFVVKVFGTPSKALNLSSVTPLILSSITPIKLTSDYDSPIVSQIEQTVKKYKIAGKTFDVQLS